MSEIDLQIRRTRRRPMLAALANVAELLLDWRQRARERRHLSAFDDRMLKDIGLSRADIEPETTKPFWRS